ncbi:MAG TPA: hypothetical protein EYM84_02670 [Flavobacteriales bacterium]|nr:hypothetical protein [Flavobacteriales bacterium]
MRILLLLLTLTLTSSIRAQPPTFDWAKSVGGPSGFGQSITTDLSGNVYVTGKFADTADFDPSVATYNLTSNGFWDIFVLKLDTGGNFIWATSMGEGYDDVGYGITTDASENVYVTGLFGGTVDFDPGVDSFNLISNGAFDVFLQKLNANGNLIWAISLGAMDSDRSYCLTIDAGGNVLIAGAFNDTVDFDPGVDTFNLISTTWMRDAFILKLDSNANFLWAKSFGGPNLDEVKSIAVDASGNVHVTGRYNSRYPSVRHLLNNF